MVEKLRNMTSIYLKRNEQLLMLYRRGGQVADGKWVGSAGGHFEPAELNAEVTRSLLSNEGELRWFDHIDIPVEDMPLTAQCVMKHYLVRGHADDRLYDGIATAETVLFSELTET